MNGNPKPQHYFETPRNANQVAPGWWSTLVSGTAAMPDLECPDIKTWPDCTAKGNLSQFQ
jgi:hypothetical protein